MVVYGSHVSNSVQPPPPFLLGGGGIELPTKFSKRGDVTGPQLLEWGCGENGG